LPTLPDLPGEAPEVRVRAARAALAGAVRRYAVLATRVLRRGDTVARVGVVAANVLGIAEPHTFLAGLAHDTGALWLLGIADRLPEQARLDELLDLLNRYQASATTQLVERWGLPAEIALACREPSSRGVRHPVERLVRVAGVLAPVVEARLDGGSTSWNDAALDALGVSAHRAAEIVRASVSALAVG
jgi:hypothetical protein